MKYLFLCAIGQNRSPTAAKVGREIADEKGLDARMSYDGIDIYLKELKQNPEDKRIKEYFESYDMIIVMEEYMQTRLLELGILKKNIRCLHIPDEYSRNDPTLKDTLRRSLELYVREKPL